MFLLPRSLRSISPKHSNFTTVVFMMTLGEMNLQRPSTGRQQDQHMFVLCSTFASIESKLKRHQDQPAFAFFPVNHHKSSLVTSSEVSLAHGQDKNLGNG